MKYQARRLRDAAVRITGLPARSWSCETERIDQGPGCTEWGDALLMPRTSEARKALAEHAEELAEQEDCVVHLGPSPFAISRYVKGGDVLGSTELLRRLEDQRKEILG